MTCEVIVFDWVTWSIWFVGLVILVVWIWIPIREFRALIAARKSTSDRP